MAVAVLLLASAALAQGGDSVVTNEVGMVASNHPLASMAGMEVLLDGGNAIDAAIGTAAALGVVEPYSSGLGGDGFMMIRSADTGEVHALNFTGRAPEGIRLEDFDEGLPTRGPASATVPGAAAGWAAAHQRFGRASREAILEPAIAFARDGYRLSAYGADAQSWAAAQFLDWEEIGAETWWGGDLQPPAPGDRVTNAALADTYESLVANGFASFYDGDVADELVRSVQEHGGYLTADDLASFEAEWADALSATYRDHQVHVPPPNSSGGLAAVQVLQILETFDPASLASNEADFVHAVIEAVKLAAADRQAWVGDPDFVSSAIPLDRLASDAYARERRASIDPDRAATDVDAGSVQSGTSHVSIVDRAGNMVSMTVSLGFGWGSGFVAGETGVVLDNGMQMFTTDPDSPTVLEGGKRGRWNMGPMIVTQDDRPFLAIGTPGGTAIWQVLPQVLVRLIDFGDDLASAVGAPRASWRLSGVAVNIESAFDEAVLETLRERGHDLLPLGDQSLTMGGVAAVLIDPSTGELVGVSDPRREGYALGW